ncbi:MAG: glutamate--cysteine ligase [Hydrogenophilales bacterium RIFOXYD1_FULL_62_11]|nr:MAG: glutamate--cysteine ligase [Hydrogenophilales bacterium RIFOXYD1_FULL_62_11]
MGQEIDRTHFSETDSRQFASRLAEETAALQSFAEAGGFSDARYVAGFELEAWLLDHAGRPNPINETYLRALNDPLVVPELSRFNVELNAPPVEMGAGVLAAMEESLLTTWDKCQQVAHGMDTVLAMIGILPTIRDEDLCLANMSAMNRFDVLNAQVLQQRDGAPIRIDIEGADHLQLSRRDVMLEAATTSFQLHLQVPFEQAARYYNATLISCAPLLAAAVNSPLLFGQRLWQETRVPVFEQAVELGGYAGLAEPTLRRVTFGRGYVANSPLELFEENLQHYPVLLPMPQEETSTRYPHLRLHNGAIWRWVRPLIGFDEAGQAHLRLEQRVLPSGPTVLDMMANAALYFGLVHALARQPVAAEAGLPFADTRTNFYAAARHGLQAELTWLDGRRYPVREFILETALPLARQGLRDFGLPDAETEHYLGVVEARMRSGQTGSAWQLQRLAKVGGDIHRMMDDYLVNQRSGAPVHEWSL